MIAVLAAAALSTQPHCPPRTLDEAVACGAARMTPKERRIFKNTPLRQLVFWTPFQFDERSPFFAAMIQKGFHFEDVRGYVQETYWLELNGCPTKVKEREAWEIAAMKTVREEERAAKARGLKDYDLKGVPERPHVDCTHPAEKIR